MSTSNPFAAAAANAPAPSSGLESKPPVRARRGCTVALIVLGGMMATALALAAAVYRALRLGPEARDLREAVQQHFEATGSWHPTVEVQLGPWWCTLARSILIEVADDPDATKVLRAARAVQVGVYEVSALRSSSERAALLRDVSETMAQRGWSRILAVIDGGSTVTAFIPQTPPAGPDLELGVVVHDENVLVIAVVRARLAPLLELMREHALEHTRPDVEAER